MIPSILAALVGALLFRTRGGWLALDPPGSGKNFKARMAWAVPTGILIGILSGSILAGLAGILLAWASLLPFGNASWQMMTDRRQWIISALVGLMRVVPLLGVMAWAESSWAPLLWAPVGVLNAPLYALGWRLPVPSWRIGTAGPVDSFTAWGELFFGALCWAVLVNA